MKISDDTKGNITTIANWIISMVGSIIGTSAVTNNDIASIIVAIIVAIINYNNMKFNNTYVQPKNAVLTETDKFENVGECEDEGAA